MKRALLISNKSGFSLVEAIIAVAVFAIIVSFVATSLATSHKYIINAGHQYRAISLAEEGLEAVRNIRDNAFTNLSDTTHGISSSGTTYAFSGSQDSTDIFLRKVYISTINSTTKEIKSEITWTDSGGSRTVSLSNRLTNWRKSKKTKPISMWPLDENSGCKANDTSGSNNGDLKPTCPTDSPIWMAGKVNSALSFDGNNDHVKIPDDNTLDLTSAGTIMAWINANGFAQDTGIVHKGQLTNKSDESYYLFVDNNKKITGGGRAAAANIFLNSPTVLSSGQWYHVVFTWDATGEKIYLNGALDSSNTSVLNCRTTGGSLQIGSQFTSGSKYFFNGLVDEVAVYDVALAADEILTIYNAQK